MNRLCAFVVILLLTSGIARGQYVNVRVDQGDSTDDEVMIAISPVDSNILAAATNIHSYFYSTDGGLSFGQGLLQSTLGNEGDPCVTFAPDGSVYVTNLGDTHPLGTSEGLTIQHSIDGGGTYNDGSSAGLVDSSDADKEWICSDLSSGPHRGRLYLTWGSFHFTDDFGNYDTSHIECSYSDDGETWSDPLTISEDDSENYNLDDRYLDGAMPAVGPDGELYVAWAAPYGVMFDRSFDGGNTFVGNEQLSQTYTHVIYDFVPGVWRTNGFPAIAVDNAPTSATFGRIYVAFAAQDTNAIASNVELVMSSDSGETWSQPMQIDSVSKEPMQFFPAVSVDPATGHVFVLYYDQRNATPSDTTRTDVYLAESSDGGTTFQSARVSTVPFYPEGAFIGDYIGVAAQNRHVYPIWTRVDPSGASIWLARAYDTVGLNISSVSASAEPMDRSVLMLRAVARSSILNSAVVLDFQAEGDLTLTIWDVTGRPVGTLLAGHYWAGTYELPLPTNLPRGTYFVRAVATGLPGAEPAQAVVRIAY